jgi:hypothetical protein
VNVKQKSKKYKLKEFSLHNQYIINFRISRLNMKNKCIDLQKNTKNYKEYFKRDLQEPKIFQK